MPVVGSYLMPRSMYSVTPKPKLPVALKFLRWSSYSFTFKPSRISVAFLPPTRWTGDLLVSPDREAAARVPRLRVDRLLARELLEHRARASIDRLRPPDAAVQD